MAGDVPVSLGSGSGRTELPDDVAGRQPQRRRLRNGTDHDQHSIALDEVPEPAGLSELRLIAFAFRARSQGPVPSAPSVLPAGKPFLRRAALIAVGFRFLGDAGREIPRVNVERWESFRPSVKFADFVRPLSICRTAPSVTPTRYAEVGRREELAVRKRRKRSAKLSKDSSAAVRRHRWARP